MTCFNIFKIEYDWYEGEHDETLLGKEVSFKKFKKDLLEAKKFAKSLIGKKAENDYLGKGYCVECLPEFYEQILWYLTEKLGYAYCNHDKNIRYNVNDDNGIKIIMYEDKINRRDIDEI